MAMSRRILAIALLLVLIATALVAVIVMSHDPLAQYRTADGRLQIPGSVFKQLMAPPQTTYTLWLPERSNYQTMQLRAHEFDLPARFVPQQHATARPAAMSDIIGALHGALGKVMNFFAGTASAATIVAAANGHWEAGGTWVGGVSPGTGDVANLAGFTVTIHTNVTVFQIDSTVASSTLIIDTSISGAAVTLTFNDTANAGFTQSAGGRQNCGIQLLGDAVNGITIESANTNPTNPWAFVGTLWGADDSLSTPWKYASLVDFADGIGIGHKFPGTPGWITFDHMTLKSNAGSAASWRPNNTTDTDQIRWVSSTFDKVTLGAVGDRVFFDTPILVNGASLDGSATAATHIIAIKNYNGTANDYRFHWGNTSSRAISDIQAGDRPASTANVTFGAGISAEKGIVDVAQTWNTVTIGTSTTLTMSGGVALTISGGGITIGAGKTLDAGSSTITVNGNWDSSAGTFTVSTSTVSFAATASIASATTSSFYNLTVTTGTSTPSNNIDVDFNLTISGGTYAKGTTTLNVDGDLVMSGGDLTSTSGSVVISGSVNISSASSAIDFGSETWDIAQLGAGNWTNASTDAAGWEKGTGTIGFRSTTSQTMTFAGTNLAEDEFNNVTFTSQSAAARTFTMATRGLRLGGTLLINDGTGTTTLDTSGSNLAVAAGAVTIGINGILTANASTITVNGNWNSSAGTFTAGTSSVDLQGGGNTVTSTSAFYTLGISGSYTTAGSIIFRSFSITGTMTMNGYAVQSMGLSTDSGTIELTSWTAYSAADTPFTEWVFNPSAAGSTVTFTQTGLTPGRKYTLERDGTPVAEDVADGTGALTLSVTGGWSPHGMSLHVVNTGGGGGSVEYITTTSDGNSTFYFTVIPKSGSVVQMVEWDFGDGTTLVVTQNPTGEVSHRYGALGSYTIMVHVTYTDGSAKDLSTTVNVKDLSPIVAPPAVSLITVGGLLMLVGFLGLLMKLPRRKTLGIVFLAGLVILLYALGYLTT